MAETHIIGSNIYIGQLRNTQRRKVPIKVIVIKNVYLASLLPEIYKYMIVSLHTYAQTSVLMLSYQRVEAGYIRKKKGQASRSSRI